MRRRGQKGSLNRYREIELDIFDGLEELEKMLGDSAVKEAAE
jgi:hypothetical protein